MGSIPFYAKRFVAGTTFHEALPIVKKLNQKNICVTLDVLGENVKKKSQCEVFTNEYLELISKISEEKLNAYVSIKLTMLGLDIDEDFCTLNLKKILGKADALSCRVAFDMEGSNYTEKTLAYYEKMSSIFRSAEIVLQAYLFRTEKDIERVLNSNGRLRLCKGAYKEPETLAFQKMSEIRENYKKLVSRLLLNGKRVCIASHDDEIINFCKDFINKNHISKDRYEFQMLYGMREKTWLAISGSGYNMTVYVPYGIDWKAYFSRRIVERKENLFFVLKNFFKS